MNSGKRLWLVLSALYELARYEAILALCGSGRILQQSRAQSITAPVKLHLV
jgi:hypothetical protein